MKTFSIVIPTYNHYDLLHQLLFDIYRSCKHVDEIVVVNDDSTDQDYYDGLDWWMSNGMLPIRHIKMKKNGGFILSSNCGIKNAKSDIICLLSSDVKVGSDISQTIPSLLNTEQKCLVGGRIIDWDSGWNRFGNTVYPYLEGWLLAATKENWQELGYLDERYVPWDAEDMDLSTNALSLGYVLVPLNDSRIVHMGGQSIGYTEERANQTRINIKKFEEKWRKQG